MKNIVQAIADNLVSETILQDRGMSIFVLLNKPQNSKITYQYTVMEAVQYAGSAILSGVLSSSQKRNIFDRSRAKVLNARLFVLPPLGVIK